MAETKNKNPHFDINASVVKQLGEELISDEVTAMMELVKNSYDADSPWVKIEINTQQGPEINSYFKDSLNFIIIQDKGEGMNYDDIVNKWLIISISEKRKMKEEGKTTIKGRTPLGDKGLGRLSTQRLGSRLELITGKSD